MNEIVRYEITKSVTKEGNIRVKETAFQGILTENGDILLRGYFCKIYTVKSDRAELRKEKCHKKIA